MSEVRHGASSNHFHCPAPWSSSHIGRGSSRVLVRGLRGALRGFAGFSEGSDPILVTLGNCWNLDAQLITLRSFDFT